MTIKVLQPGVGIGRRIYGDDDKGSALTRLNVKTLSDLSDDYVLFTYAPLFLYGGLTFNPIQEWINLNDAPQVIDVVELESPIFDMGNARCDRLLWAVRKEYWQSLSLHIGSIGIVDRDRKRFTRVVCQELPIIENNKPTTVFTFSVDSSWLCLAFLPQRTPGERLKLHKLPTREETDKLTKALFNNVAQPYEGIQEN